MKRIVLCIALILFSSPALGVSWRVSWDRDCGGCCYVGTLTQFDFDIMNEGDDTFMIDMLKLETDDGKVIATLGEIDGSGWSLNPGDKMTLYASGELPRPKSGTLIRHRPGLYLVYGENQSKGAWSYAPEYELMSVPSQDMHACDSHADCADDEYCARDPSDPCITQCVAIQTSECGYIENHLWKDYDCCADGDCSEGFECVAHDCYEKFVPTPPPEDRSWAYILVLVIIIIIALFLIFMYFPHLKKSIPKIEEKSKRKS